MNKSLKWLLISIFFILLIICGIITFLFISTNKNNSDEVIYIENQEPKKELTKVNSRSLYYKVKGCINKYYTYCNLLYSSDDSNTEETINIAKAIYNMLDKEYTSYYNITENNLLEQLERVNNFALYIDSMYYIEDDNYNDLCIADGTLRDIKTNNLTKFKVIVRFDYNNKTFSIIPNDYAVQKYSNIMLGQKLNIEQDIIEKNNNNAYITRQLSEEDYVEELFNDFKDKGLYDINALYELLDEEYKSKKFENASELKKYLNNKYADFNTLQLISYSIEKYDGYNQYTMIDSAYSRFVINETATMEYTIIPDIYTIDLPNYKNNYQYANEQGKIILNMDKILSALNNHDYKYLYTKLSDGFKYNNFKTYEAFEEYAKENFFYKNKFEYTSIKKEGQEYYTCDTKITDLFGITDIVINKTFIILLRRGYRVPNSF